MSGIARRCSTIAGSFGDDGIIGGDLVIGLALCDVARPAAMARIW